MRKIFFAAVVLLVSLGLIWYRPHFEPTAYSGADAEMVEGKVIEILSEREVTGKDVAFLGMKKIQRLLVEMEKDGAAEKREAVNDFSALKKGERVFLQALENGSLRVVEISRTRSIVWLALIFVVLVLLVSGKKGAYSLIGLVYSFAIILSFIVPRILGGMNPILVSLIGAILILTVTLYVSYGFNKKSLSAFIGITLTLFVVGLLAQYFVNALHFTGFGSEELAYLQQAMSGKIDFVALIIGGIIIAAIGVLDDIAITQASAVFALASVNTSMTRWNLYKKAMEVGKDHVAAVINTLILAYTGAALPLVLLLSIGNEIHGGQILSIEIVSEEIVRMLVSSSGLILAVPATTFVAVLLVTYGATPRQTRTPSR